MFTKCKQIRKSKNKQHILTPQAQTFYLIPMLMTFQRFSKWRQIAAGHPLCGWATPQTAVRPFGGWPGRRAYKGRAWRARMNLQGVCGYPFPYGPGPMQGTRMKEIVVMTRMKPNRTKTFIETELKVKIGPSARHSQWAYRNFLTYMV